MVLQPPLTSVVWIRQPCHQVECRRMRPAIGAMRALAVVLVLLQMAVSEQFGS